MVEWKKLGEVCKVHTGSQLNRSDMLEVGPYPVVNGGKEYSGYTDKFNENANSITISQGGESAGFVNWVNISFWAGAHCYVVEIPEGYDSRYLYHTLKNKERDIQLSKQGAGIPGLNRDTLYKQVIPVPTLSVQTRIVGILDTFTSAIDNLKEQIAQRRKQYEYYRDQLLDLEGKERVEWKKLGDVANLVRGKVISKDYIRDFGGEFPVYSSQTANDGVLGKINSYMFDGDYLTWTTDGAYAGTIFRRKGKFSITNVCGLIDISCSNIQQDFLYFWLSKTAKDYVLEGMGNPKLMSNVASTIKIPIPPLQEQQRIVSILDTFEASIQNLEAQLKEREKQYEYYRNKLLTFE